MLARSKEAEVQNQDHANHSDPAGEQRRCRLPRNDEKQHGAEQDSRPGIRRQFHNDARLNSGMTRQERNRAASMPGQASK